MTQVTKARIPARISMKNTIQRNILALRKEQRRRAAKAWAASPGRNWSLEPAASAAIEKLQGGRPDHHADRQQPEGPGRRNVGHQPGEVHPEGGGDECQGQEERRGGRQTGY